MARAANGTIYELSGPAGAPAVVLIHGLGSSRKSWRETLPAFAQSYRVLAYDLYGHGESVAGPGEASLGKLSRQLAGLMDELGIDRGALVGFSLGGMINRRFAIDHPKRVSALAILNSPHERGAEAQRHYEEQAAKASAGGPAATLDAAIARWFTPEFIAARPDVIAETRKGVLANDPVNYAAWRMVLAKGVVELIRPDPPITAPSLVMTCEHDSGSTPAMSHAIASEIAGSRTIIVPGLQHLGLAERPELFTEPVLAFLDEVLVRSKGS